MLSAPHRGSYNILLPVRFTMANWPLAGLASCKKKNCFMNPYWSSSVHRRCCGLSATRRSSAGQLSRKSSRATSFLISYFPNSTSIGSHSHLCSIFLFVLFFMNINLRNFCPQRLRTSGIFMALLFFRIISSIFPGLESAGKILIWKFAQPIECWLVRAID